jgi:hypothetical protein
MNVTSSRVRVFNAQNKLTAVLLGKAIIKKGNVGRPYMGITGR